MRKTYWIAAVLAAVMAAWMLTPAIGQDDDRPPRRNDQGGRGGRMPMMGMQPASICALGNALYVVRGNTIYKIDPETLQVVKKATYEEDQMMKKPPQGGPEGGPDEGPPPDEGR